MHSVGAGVSARGSLTIGGNAKGSAKTSSKSSGGGFASIWSKMREDAIKAEAAKKAAANVTAARKKAPAKFDPCANRSTSEVKNLQGAANVILKELNYKLINKTGKVDKYTCGALTVVAMEKNSRLPAMAKCAWFKDACKKAGTKLPTKNLVTLQQTSKAKTATAKFSYVPKSITKPKPAAKAQKSYSLKTSTAAAKKSGIKKKPVVGDKAVVKKETASTSVKTTTSPETGPAAVFEDDFSYATYPEAEAEETSTTNYLLWGALGLGALGIVALVMLKKKKRQ